jgi:hypothetical protein
MAETVLGQKERKVYQLPLSELTEILQP